MKKIAFLFIILIFVQGCSNSNNNVKITNIKENSNIQACPSNIAESVISSAFISGINLTIESLQVNKERCDVQGIYHQVELEGKYVENGESKPLYFHAIYGGMAASGSDTYNEVCLIIDDDERISKIQKGAQLVYQGPARCKWRNSYP